jgi:carnitine 3-dehydrogenase
VTGAQYAPPASVSSVAVVGTGVIGAGWAAHFLRMGFGVTAWDPGDGAAERLTASVRHAWPVLEKLGLRPGASLSRLRSRRPGRGGGRRGVRPGIGPGDPGTETALLAELDAATPPGVVIRVEHVRLHDERHGGQGPDARSASSPPTRSTRT